MTVEQIREELLQKYLEDIERMSFPNKVKEALAVLRSDAVSGIIPEFNFTENEFVEIDKLRHTLVHEPKFSEPILNAKAMLVYMVNTMRLLVALAERKYPGPNPR